MRYLTDKIAQGQAKEGTKASQHDRCRSIQWKELFGTTFSPCEFERISSMGKHYAHCSVQSSGLLRPPVTMRDLRRAGRFKEKYMLARLAEE